MAKTPLAVADASAANARIMFANEAFAALAGIAGDALVGRPLHTLAPSFIGSVEPGATARFELGTPDGAAFHAALSIALVTGPGGAPFCLLCSMVDARGDDAEAAIARDAALLQQVADAAGALMRESAAAAMLAAPEANDRPAAAAEIALHAVERVTHADAQGDA